MASLSPGNDAVPSRCWLRQYPAFSCMPFHLSVQALAICLSEFICVATGSGLSSVTVCKAPQDQVVPFEMKFPAVASGFCTWCMYLSSVAWMGKQPNIPSHPGMLYGTTFILEHEQDKNPGIMTLRGSFERPPVWGDSHSSLRITRPSQ